MEAEVLRIDALAESGHTDAAHARAREFLRRHPNSVLAAHVRTRLGRLSRRMRAAGAVFVVLLAAGCRPTTDWLGSNPIQLEAGRHRSVPDASVPDAGVLDDLCTRSRDRRRTRSCCRPR